MIFVSTYSRVFSHLVFGAASNTLDLVIDGNTNQPGNQLGNNLGKSSMNNQQIWKSTGKQHGKKFDENT